MYSLLNNIILLGLNVLVSIQIEGIKIKPFYVKESKGFILEN